ncbi:MAG: DUF1844 domain-containing protein [Candidatus Zixiibacteriota bacterium]
MSEESFDKIDAYLFQLILSLQAGAMQQMGKIVSPITGKVERDLTMARNSIDMLDMLQKKTAGNLTEEEGKLLTHVLYELRLNYVDEAKKGDGKRESPKASEEKAKESGENAPESGADEEK